MNQSFISQKVLRLSFSLAKSHIKIKNEGSYLGFLWYVLNPIGLFLTILFIKQSAFSNIQIPLYPLYLLVGLSSLNFLNRIISTSVDLIRGNGSFIKFIKFPIQSLVISSVIHILFLYVVEFIIIAFLSQFFGIPPINLLYYIFFIILFTVFLLGVSFMFSVLGAYIVDIGNVWVVISQILLFITPIFYVLDGSSSNSLISFNSYNPLYYFIKLGRDVLLQGQIDLHVFLVCTLLSLTSVLIGVSMFNVYKGKFAELV